MSELQPTPAPTTPPPAPPVAKKKKSLLWLWILLGVLGLLLLMSPFILIAAVMGMVASGPTGGGVGEGVAIIRIDGVITAGRSGSSFMESGVAGSETIVKQIQRAVDDYDAKAILVRINSPGGSAAGSEEVYHKLLEARQSKPVVISMGDVAASGGYYIASAGEAIFCNGGTVTGSIGVISTHLDISKLLDKVGANYETMTTGEFKDMGNFSRPLTTREKQLMEDILGDIHEQFVEAVAKGRKMPKEKVLKLADGRVFTGRQALEAGLVDKIGGLEPALAAAASMGNISGEPRKIEYGPGGLLEWLIGVDDYTMSLDAVARQMLLRHELKEASNALLR